MVAAAAWRAIGASVRGASHVASGAPNQDAFACAPPRGEPGVRAIAAVADGHGAAIHFRSARGSRIAVEVALGLLADPAVDRATLPQRIVAAWAAQVRADLAREPFTERELRELAQPGEVRADPLLAYGTTLLACRATGDSLLALQIGDGDALAVRAGRVTRLVPRDERLRNSYTTSLCAAGASADFRVHATAAGEELPPLLLLSTDGYANAFKTEADFLRVGTDFLEMLEKQGVAAVARELEGFLADASEHGSGDDVSAALLYRGGTPA